MGIEAVSDLLRDTIWMSLVISAPILVTALATGLVISIFQAATQVNEQTLTFVPKIVLTLVAFGAGFPYFMTTLVEFTRRIFHAARGNGAVSIAIPLDWLTGFGLALTRLIGAFLYAPVFGHAVVPGRVRLMIALALAFWLSSDLAVDPGAPGFSLGFALLREATIGLAIGFAASLVFTGFALMGEYAAMQGGLGAAAVLDPSTGNNSVVLTSLVGVLAGLVFLAIEGHHDVLRGLVLSFEALPVGGAGPDVFGFVQLAQLGAVIFEVGVKLAAPFTAVMLVSNLAVGILGRAIPQLNLMSLQLPAQIGLTLLILGLAAGPFVDEVGAVLRAELPRAVTVLWETP